MASLKSDEVWSRKKNYAFEEKILLHMTASTEKRREKHLYRMTLALTKTVVDRDMKCRDVQVATHIFIG